MDNFPKIAKAVLLETLDNLYKLYGASPDSLLKAAEKAALKANIQYQYKANMPADQQLAELRQKVSLRAGNKGFNLFIYLSEQLLEDLKVQLLPGFGIEDLLQQITIQIDKNVRLYLSNENIWKVRWSLEIAYEVESLEVSLRIGSGDGLTVVPNYVFENLEQGMAAFNKGSYGVSLSLLSISLESALRDTLVLLGYDYSASGSSIDIYEMSKLKVTKSMGTFSLEPLEAMPKSIDDFLSDQEQDSVEINIKRAKNNKGKWYLKITSGTDDIKDFITKESIEANGVKSVSGLGAALKIAREDEDIIKNHMFPLDLDSPVKAVRNNLIHLSGEAMNEDVHEGKSLKEFIKSTDLVFDTISSITVVIEDLYLRISNGEFIAD
jgi:hypothetical protein